MNRWLILVHSTIDYSLFDCKSQTCCDWLLCWTMMIDWLSSVGLCGCEIIATFQTLDPAKCTVLWTLPVPVTSHLSSLVSDYITKISLRQTIISERSIVRLLYIPVDTGITVHLLKSLHPYHCYIHFKYKYRITSNANKYILWRT